MAKSRGKGLIAGMIILLFVAVALLLIATLPIIKDSMLYDNSNTIEHSATVKNVITKDKSYEIEVDEYSCTLFFSKEEVIDEKSLLELCGGEKITFNVPESLDKALTDNVPSVWIVSLKTDNAAIVTFESHGKKEYEDYKKTQITAFVFHRCFSVGRQFVLCA